MQNSEFCDRRYQSHFAPLTTVAWELYTAISKVVTPHSGDYSLSINLSSFEISATGSRKSFAQIKDLDNCSTIQNDIWLNRKDIQRLYGDILIKAAGCMEISFADLDLKNKNSVSALPKRCSVQES